MVLLVILLVVQEQMVRDMLAEPEQLVSPRLAELVAVAQAQLVGREIVAALLVVAVMELHHQLAAHL